MKRVKGGGGEACWKSICLACMRPFHIYMKGRGEGGMCMCVQVSHESKGGFG